MSLVVAMIDNGRMHVCADLRVVKADIVLVGARRHIPNYFNGVLKIIPISSRVAVAYAGTVPIALDTIRAVKNSGCPPEEVPEALLGTLKDSNNVDECDFLVLDAGELVIHRIRNGEITTLDKGRTWIGDSSACSLFLSKLEELGYDSAPNPIAKSSVMMNSLDAVIADSSVTNVGEFPISAFNHNGEFQLSVAFAAVGPAKPLKPGLNPVSFSNDMNDDALTINLTIPVDRGVAAVGVYLSQAHRGALYLPLVKDEPFLIDGNTIGEFRANVLKDHGIELLGGGFE